MYLTQQDCFQEYSKVSIPSGSWASLLTRDLPVLHNHALKLRKRKYVPCFYPVIETQVEVWENEKSCGNMSQRRVFPQLLWVLPNFHECFYNSIETRSTCFLFLLENTATQKGNNLLTLINKMYIFFAHAITTSTVWASSVSPSSYTNTIFNQSARMLS